MKILVEGKTITFVDNSNKLKGAHLGAMFKRQVRDNIIDKEYRKQRKFTRKPQPYYYSFLVKDNLPAEGQMIKSVDITNCYWETAYIRNLLTPELYLYGLDGGKDYKQIRNACVGSLASIYYHTDYVNGKKIREFPKLNRYRRMYYDVVGYVFHKTAKPIMRELIDELVYFLTDCFFITGKEQFVFDLLDNLGYEYKVNDIIFKGHTETSGTIRIEWVKEGDEKYYEFNKGEQVF